MAEKTTFIKLDRNILNWGWFQQGETLKMFLYFILTASIRDRQWQGVALKRGQLVTSIRQLADKLQMTPRGVRTSLNRLKSTGEVTQQSTNRYTVITVNNYDKYQSSGTPGGKRPAQDRQAGGTAAAQEQEYKKDQKDKKDQKGEKRQTAFVPPTLEQVRAYCAQHNPALDAERFLNFYQSKGWMVGSSPMRDWKAAVRGWRGGRSATAYSGSRSYDLEQLQRQFNRFDD